MDQASPSRRSFWRFSLRELILLMLATGAFLGWGVTIFRRYRPLQPTPFAEGLLLEADIAAVRQQIGESGDPGTGMRSDGGGTTGRRIQRDYVYSFALTPDRANTFMKVLRDRLVDKIRAQGGMEGRMGYGGVSFHMDYEFGTTEGTLRAYLNPGDTRAQMFVFLHEQRQPP